MKNVFILLFLSFSSVCLAQIIDFPDANFKNALVNTKCVDLDGDGTPDADADVNNDGEIDVNEAFILENLDVSAANIHTLDSIHLFKNIKKLECQQNELTRLDLSINTSLQLINCRYNKIESLNVDGLMELKDLFCAFNRIDDVNLVTNKKLETLHCGSNSLSELKIKNLINLKSIECQGNKLQKIDVSGLVNLVDLTCSYNIIEELDLRNAIRLESLACNNNHISKLKITGLNKLLELNCNENLLSELDLGGLKNLKYLLDCSHNQITTLDISGSNRLERLFCNDNFSLKTINIKKGSKLSYFNMGRNSNLVYICCDDDEIIRVRQLTILNNLNNVEVNSYCTFTPGGKFYSIIGKNHLDINSNGCDESDFIYPNLRFHIFNSLESGTLISNSTGSYFIPLQGGTHIIKPILENPNHFIITPDSITIKFPSTSDTITQDFCITPKGNFRKTNITVIPLTPPARPGFDVKYKIVWENVGNQIESGTLTFTYDETLLDYISATHTADQVADGIVKWNFTNLLPFEKREIIVTLKVNKPMDTPPVNVGDKLYLTASILDNIFTLENTVVGSYDPNDKTCLQGDRVHPDMIGKYVDYLIRFENTGNYAAENVVVKDIIDTKRFDVSSLQITDASHEVYTRIEGNKVEFIFENIQLPFDDANNDGYIAFKIKTLPTLVLGDSLKNLADIYFDYNFPIRTNEAQTTVAFPVFTNTTDVHIYPNPFLTSYI
ncbi:MAG: T9SS C-terminal target domain-containing protein [Saprospiraceae bacterium]|nr:T9SS C-terminal target domain-containing protein [Saprospiraceae bacterium]